LFKPFGFEIETFIDEPELYILVAVNKGAGLRIMAKEAQS
jgi:hypothetical protein